MVRFWWIKLEVLGWDVLATSEITFLLLRLQPSHTTSTVVRQLKIGLDSALKYIQCYDHFINYNQYTTRAMTQQ